MAGGNEGGLVQRAMLAYLNRLPKIAYIHVPKCAGVSAVNALYRAAYPSFLKPSRAYRRINLRSSRLAEEILGVDMMKSREAVLISCLNDPLSRFVAGHVHAHPETVRAFGEWKFVTLLREPRQRFLSHYIFNRFKRSDWTPLGDDFPDYVQTGRARRSGAAMACYFSGMSLGEIEQDPDRAVAASLANLGHFASVGFLDDLEDWLGRLESLLGGRPKFPHANKSPKPEGYDAIEREIEASAELSAMVDRLCTTDRKIYEAARASF